MPRRATRLLDDTIEPETKKTGSSTNKRFSAVFLLFLGGSTPKQEEKVVEAPNLPAAINIARKMCLNPSIFPAGCVARIPDRNVTPLPDELRLRRYQASFELYRLGDRKRRPHTVLMDIDAQNIHEAIKKAKTIVRETPGQIPGAFASDLITCPAKNVRPLK